jgi:methylmalonyl-CoA/ethylmalonyl-CoA epimerase
MEPSHIEHIGIAVKELAPAIEYYEKLLEQKCYSIEEVAEQKVRTAFFKVGETKIELLEPTSEESPIAKYLEKNPHGGVHHIAFAVDGIQKVLDEVAASGIQLIDKTPRKGAEGLDIGFLHPKSTFGVLTEICENPNK